MQNEIILIGPICSGKSSVGEIISAKLGWPQYSMDDIRFRYYKEIGYSQEDQNRIRSKEGYRAMYQYWKPFEAHAVKRFLEEHKGGVHDFGAGHSVYEDDLLFGQVKHTLEPYRNVVLLLPSSDQERTIDILENRLKLVTDNQEVFDLNKHFVEHPSNYELAKHIVYTEGNTAEETAAEVIRICQVGLNGIK
ncbi:shikimate kinase [Bacillus sp. 1P06AnD]|uniref:shikimate kinase n=1 Tax=Bacillus sp. 1P06AnD TaxID=3132208 RepID=UPI0039A13DA5